MHINTTITDSIIGFVGLLVRYFVYGIICLVTLFGLVVLYLFLSDPSTQRRIAADSLLVNYEPRIASVTQEMQRRSPGYTAALRGLENCLWPMEVRYFGQETDPECDPAPYLRQRNEALLRDWGLLIERFQVAGDWGEWSRSSAEHERWQELVPGVGLDQLRYHCQPVVEWRPEQDVEVYIQYRRQLVRETFTGVRCGSRFVPFE